MKTINIFFVLLVIISCKTNNDIIPKELNIKWYDILYDGESFYKKGRLLENNPFDNETMIFDLESGDEYEKIKQVIKTEYGYRIIFKEFRFNSEFRFYWIDKKQGIAKWEYYNNDTDFQISNYSYYTINDINGYNKLLDKTDYDSKRTSNTKKKDYNESIINSSEEETWKLNCNEYANLHIDNDSLFTFPVNSNTMYINVLVKKDTGNKYNLYYHNIEELGKGVKESLDWGNFSKDSILATLKMKDRYLFLEWRGFYNKLTKKRTWVDQIDFQENSKNIKNIRLERCNINESY